MTHINTNSQFHSVSLLRNDEVKNDSFLNRVAIKISEKSKEDNILKEHKTKTNRSCLKNFNPNGGRLQFYKDGKFIFELARSKKGEKFEWVPVPKRIFESTSVQYKTNYNYNFLKQNKEAVSLQRKNKWKQLYPRKQNIFEGLFFKRNNFLVLSTDGERLSCRKKRQPLNQLMCSSPFKKENISLNLQKENKPQLKNNITNRSISEIIQKLLNQVALTPKSESIYLHRVFNSFSYLHSKDFQNRELVSPRKRILKELEKVTLEDCTKRCRSKETFLIKAELTKKQTQCTNKCIQSSESLKIKNEKLYKLTSPTSSKLRSSYSIHSLLGNCRTIHRTIDVNGKKINGSHSDVAKISEVFQTKGKNMINTSHSSQLTSNVFKNGSEVMGYNQSNVQILEAEDLSSIEYSNIFDLDRLKSNFQSCIPNQHFYFPTIFAPQNLSNPGQNTFEAIKTVKSLSAKDYLPEYTENNNAIKLTKSNLYSEISNEQEDLLPQYIKSSSIPPNNIIVPTRTIRPHADSQPCSKLPAYYMPHVSYYHPYAASAMRHHLWMHYQSKVRTHSIGKPSSLVYSEQFAKDASIVRECKISETSESVFVKNVQSDCDLDLPLNLSKH